MDADLPKASENLNTPVLVVGGGPVGAILALELARYNVPSMVVERATRPSRHPKMDYINGRSMELLRRLGLSEPIRKRGIASEHSADFLWTTGFQRPPVAVWHQPSVDDLSRRYAEVNDGTVPAEPYHRVQGSLLEELVRDAAREHPLVDFREGWTFTGLQACGEGVTAFVVDSTARVRHGIRTQYLAACDGARSTVRRCLEIDVDDSGPRSQHCSVYFKSRDPGLRRYGRAFVTIVAAGLTLVSRDEDDTWTGSLLISADEPFTDDPIAIIKQRLGQEFVVDEVLSVAQWEGSLAVARSYRSGPVFLAGDSAHQFFPTGGHGANTGIADAVDLGWKLAGRVNGWAGPAVLDSYEIERRPVALFNREMSGNLLEVWRRFGRLAAAGASREQLAGFLAEDVYQVSNSGIHFGYRYEDSPVVCQEDGPAPPWRWQEIVPTTWPGGRPPAVRLSSGENVFDLFGVGFTLVDTSGTNAGERLVADAVRRGVPMTHLPLTDPAVRDSWERPLVLVRPDQHVAWRGSTPPADWDAVLSRVTGHAEVDSSVGGIP